KPREWRSRTISKYFSMNSMRPWKMHTVPLRSRGGDQRANLIEIPSRVFRTPTTAPWGTGLAGMETSFIEEYFHEFGPRPTASLIGIIGSTQQLRGGAPDNSAGGSDCARLIP